MKFTAQYINSRENRIYKDCRRLAQKKYRDREGRYLIEGHNLVDEAFQNGAEVEYVIVDTQKNDSAEYPVQVYEMDPVLFTKLAQTETSQGVMAVVRKREFETAEISEICGEGTNILVLDRLQDPGNIGTMMRTAEGAGYACVAAVKGTADIYGPKTVRAAAGSVFRIPVVYVNDGRELKELTEKLGKKLTVTSLDADEYYYDTDIAHDTALVIGNEGNGVSDELMEMADIKIKIPMSGRLESLNASVAAGILMYEAVRKNKNN